MTSPSPGGSSVSPCQVRPLSLSLSLSLSVLHQLVPGACVLSFTWIMLMRCVGGAMVWLSLLIIISLLLSAVILSASRLHRVSHSSLPPKVGSQRTVSPPSYNSLSGRPRPYFSCRAGRNKANLVDIDNFVIGDTRLCFACCFCDQTGTRRINISVATTHNYWNLYQQMRKVSEL